MLAEPYTLLNCEEHGRGWRESHNDWFAWFWTILFIQHNIMHGFKLVADISKENFKVFFNAHVVFLKCTTKNMQ